MKKFLLKTSFFVGFLIFIFASNFILNKYLANFNIESKKNVLIVGDSKSECAFNDEMIENTSNFSVLGESFFYNFFKTKKLIEQNPQIKFVLVEISNSQLNSNMDRRIWGEKYMPFKFPVYAPFMDFESLNILQKRNPKEFNSSYISIIKTNFKMLKQRMDYTIEIKGSKNLNRILTDSIISKSTINKETYEVESDYSRIIDFKYLHKIISYCDSKGVKVYLIRSPLHKQYYGFINESHFQNVIKNEFSKVEFLDFSRFPLSTDKYADLNHLNKYGSEIFSKWFDASLKKGLLKKKEKQHFINEMFKTQIDN